LLILLGSFLAIHLFAVLGPFLILMYPILVIFSPDHQHCIFCILRGRNFTSCKIQEIFKTTRHYQVFLLDVFFLLLASLLSFGLLCAEKKLIERTGYLPITQKTAIVQIAENGTYRIGEISLIPIQISDISSAINVVQADIQFDPTQIEIQDVLVGESFADIFIQKDIRNDLGFARVTGGVPNPGFTKESGIFAKLLIRCKDSGVGKISILPTSKVLANDGKATNVLAEFSDHSYYISQEKLTIPELEAQEDFLTSKVLGVSNSKFEFYNENITEGFEFENNQQQENSQLFLSVAYTYITFITDPVLNLF